MGVLTALTCALVSTSTAAASPATIAVPQPRTPLSVLQPDPARAELYRAAGIDMVTLELGWDAYQPRAGTTDQDYVRRQLATAQRFRAAGLGVVLDLGLQYPPAWSFDLSAGTRFVDQYGQTWRGETGTDALNAVWEPLARDAEADYVHQVAADFADIPFVSVRVGGLLSGELRLPPPGRGGDGDSLWGFDRRALSASPVPGWRPGRGSADEAARWLDFYLESLADYATWLTVTVADAFESTPLDVLMPGWGMRPGDVDAAVAALSATGSLGDTAEKVGPALDWVRQVEALAATGVDLTLVTTWLDAPSYGPSERDESPADHLARLAVRHGLPLSGENTGGGGPAALERTRIQAAALSVTRVTWMSGPSLASGTDVSLQDLARAFPRGTRPGVPRAVVARPMGSWVLVSWSPPGTDGGNPVTTYEVSGGARGPMRTTGDHTVVLLEVPVGVPQTFTVTAANEAGPGMASLPTPPVIVTSAAAAEPWTTRTSGGSRQIVSPDGRSVFLVTADGTVLLYALGQERPGAAQGASPQTQLGTAAAQRETLAGAVATAATGAPTPEQPASGAGRAGRTSSPVAEDERSGRPRPDWRKIIQLVTGVVQALISSR